MQRVIFFIENNLVCINQLFKKKGKDNNRRCTVQCTQHNYHKRIKGGGGADWNKSRAPPFWGPKYIRFPPSSSFEIGHLSMFQPGVRSNLIIIINPPLIIIYTLLNNQHNISVYTIIANAFNDYCISAG